MAMIAVHPAALVTAIVITPRILSHTVRVFHESSAARPAAEAAANGPAASIAILHLTCTHCPFLPMLIGCPRRGGVTGSM